MTIITLLNTDNMAFMRDMDDNAFDLAIVDPPYGVGNKWIKNNKSRTKLATAKAYKLYANEKKDRPTPEFFQELKRVSRNQIIWGANHLCDLFDAHGPCWVSWDKDTSGAFSDMELAYTSFPWSAKTFKYRWNGMLQGAHGNKRLNEQRIHPSQKPVALYRWLLHTFAEPGYSILDTHMGSASSAIAAKQMGFDYVGTEIDKDYYDAAVIRYDQETAQQQIEFER